MRAEPDTPEGCCDDLPEGYKCQPSCQRRIQNDETALAVDVGYYFDFDVDPETGRPSGCPAFDDQKRKNWSGSDVVDCDKQSYAPEGEALSDIVEDFADNQDHWIRDFLTAFEKMSNNGYDASELTEGPTGWYGAKCEQKRVKRKGKIWYCE